ncbi:MAG: exonuclease domain-containing protein [Campylobacterales bacterium]
MKYIVLDTETTGMEEEDRIIQLSYFILENGKETVIHNEYCKAPVDIRYEAMAAHHITPEMVDGKPEFCNTSATKTLYELNEPENYLFAHNASFDLDMLKKEGFECKMKIVDTLRCARHLFPENDYHSLQYFRYALGLYRTEKEQAKKIGLNIQAHDALSDVFVLKMFISELTKMLSPEYKGIDAIKHLVELSNTPVYYAKPLKFGKYKGKTLEEIAENDLGYLQWAFQNMDNLDEDMKWSIQKHL